MYKAPFTALAVAKFLSSYGYITAAASEIEEEVEEPFVYVDEQFIKLITNVVATEETNQEGVFALSVAEDGWMQMLALNKHRG